MTTTQIAAGIAEIETALGEYLCTDARPCAACADYDAGEAKPWRVYDDHASERFVTLAEAVAGAKAWAESMAAAK